MSDSGCPAYRRVLLKLSGEVFKGSFSYGIDPAMVQQIATEIKLVHDAGIECADSF